MAGLVPAIHGWAVVEDVDARDKPGHDVVTLGFAVIPDGRRPSRDRKKVLRGTSRDPGSPLRCGGMTWNVETRYR